VPDCQGGLRAREHDRPDGVRGRYYRHADLVVRSGAAPTVTDATVSTWRVSVEDMRWLFDINFWGTVYGTRLFLPLLRQQHEAQIVNIASVFGIMAVAGQTAYAASKFAVRGFSDALRHELGGSRITVTTVYPSGVRTDIARSARVPAKFDQTRAAAMIAGFDKLAQTTPEQAATRIVRGVKRGEQRILVGNGAKLMAAIAWLVPVRYWRIVDRPLAPMALRKPGGR
jgi:short-subunit dehydrogenase